MRPVVAILTVVSLLLALAGGFWLGQRDLSGKNKSTAATNFDPRGLTPQEDSVFSALICPQRASAMVTSYGQSYRYNCRGLTRYPDAHAGEGDEGVTFTSIIYGHITDAKADQAYTSYQGSLEPLADHLGGGILFQKQGAGWRLVRWYPGGQLDDCLMLTPTGQAKMLCCFTDSGQGEIYTGLCVVSVPSSYNPDTLVFPSEVSVIEADDDRDTSMPNANCDQRASPHQGILLSVDNITRVHDPELFATATIEYVLPDAAASSCAAGNFGTLVTPSFGRLNLSWDGRKVSVQMPAGLAP